MAATGLAGVGGKRIEQMSVGVSGTRCALSAFFTRQGEHGLERSGR
ncbi:hypothetical protein HCG45_10365 [Pseudomonas fulva]|nr:MULTISPECIES: hypothetical protein [Pseudomonas]NIX93148.1 hypothetical protein [Pseudomonas fulva]